LGVGLSEDGGTAGLLFERDLRWELEVTVVEVLSAEDLSLMVDETDFVRER
jgi:hypothetical protein